MNTLIRRVYKSSGLRLEVEELAMSGGFSSVGLILDYLRRM